METATATTSDHNNALDTINTAMSNTDAQSVQSGATQPHSPSRTAITPLSLSPASHSKAPTKIQDNAIGKIDAIPRCRSQQQKQHGDLSLGTILDQQQQQEALNLSYQQHRQSSNPVSDDDHTEPSSSANTGENNVSMISANNNGAVGKGYTRSDMNIGATSTFGRLVKSAAKVSLSD